MVVTKPDQEKGEVTDVKELERQTEDEKTGSGESAGSLPNVDSAAAGRENFNGFLAGSNSNSNSNSNSIVIVIVIHCQPVGVIIT